MAGELVGYARTSTVDQKAGLADQVAQLRRLRCDRIFEEHGSGVDAARPKLGELLDYVRPGDIVVVTKPDRIARSTADLLAIVEKIRAKGAEIRVLSMNLDTKDPQGKLMLTVLGAVAEFERDLMLERQRAGIAAAKAAGKYKGRTPVARKQADRIAELKTKGMTAAAIAEQLGISVRSVYRHAGRFGGIGSSMAVQRSVDAGPE